jgi:hypothetical protein
MKLSGRLQRILLAGVLCAGNAWADPHGRPYPPHGRPHGSVEFGIVIGGPWIYPPYHPYPPYWPRIYVPPVAPVIVTPPPPPVYIEQQNVAVPQLEPGYWYYCEEAGAYYPYVKECPGSWRKVAPRPNP